MSEPNRLPVLGRADALRLFGGAGVALLAGCAGGAPGPLPGLRPLAVIQPCTVDCPTGGGGGGEAYTVVTNGNKSTILNGYGADVLDRIIYTDSLYAASYSASQTITNPGTLSWQVGQSANLGGGISVSVTSSTQATWTGPGNNSGVVYVDSSNNLWVTTTTGQTRTSQVAAVMPQWLTCFGLGLVLVAAVAGLIASTIVMGGQLGLDPLADAAFYAAYIGVLGATAAYQGAGC